MRIERAMEILNQITDFVCIGENSHGAIEQLLNMGFTAQELVDEFGWSLTDVQEVEEGLKEDG